MINIAHCTSCASANGITITASRYYTLNYTQLSEILQWCVDSTVSRPACLCRPVCLPLLAVCSPRRSCRTTACPGFVLASLECFSRAFIASSCSCLTHTTTRNSLLIFNIVGFPHYLTIQTCKLFVQISPRVPQCRSTSLIPRSLLLLFTKRERQDK